MKQEIKNDWILFWIGFQLGTSILLIMCGIVVFYTGFHNTDLSGNILKLAYYENFSYESYVDVYSVDGIKIMNYDMAYILGMK